MVKIFNKLMEVRDVAHLIHLNKSFTQSAHEALEGFYSDMLEYMDEFIEVYQGQFGLVDDFGSFGEVDYDDHILYFEEFLKFIQDSRKDIKEEAVHLNAILDDVAIAGYKLLYKLKYLQ